jgi:hypothetical protein
MGIGITGRPGMSWPVSPGMLGAIAGSAIALIFFLRMRIEELAGKVATRQKSLHGFEIEDLLYLLPFVTLCGGVAPFLFAAAVGAPLFALWVALDYVRSARRLHPVSDVTPGVV